jgi:hypothetical protein
MTRVAMSALASVLFAFPVALISPAVPGTTDSARACRAQAGQVETTSYLFHASAAEAERQAFACGAISIASGLRLARMQAGKIHDVVKSTPGEAILPIADVTDVRSALNEIQDIFARLTFPATLPCHDDLLEQTRALHDQLEWLAKATSIIVYPYHPCSPDRPFCAHFSFVGEPVGPASNAPVCGDFPLDIS